MTDGSGDSASDSRPESESDPYSDPDSSSESFTVPIDAVQPSQCYLNGRKLALVARWFDFGQPNYDPLPVRKVGSEGDGERRWMLTDGHTRAFVSHLAGADVLRVVQDSDDLQIGLYRQCVEWCEEEGVTEIGDLTGRVLNADDFEERWVARCRSALEGE